METFRSKIDTSYYVILGLYGLMSISFCLFAKSAGSFLFVGLLFIFIIIQLHAVKYKIDSKSNKLIITAGVFYNSSINISSIVSIEKDRSASASPAASFDGIRITTSNSKTVKISPKDQKLFIERLLSNNPQICIKL